MYHSPGIYTSEVLLLAAGAAAVRGLEAVVAEPITGDGPVGKGKLTLLYRTGLDGRPHDMNLTPI